MGNQRLYLFLICFCLLTSTPTLLWAQQNQSRTLSFSGDFRFRAEFDRDSQRPDGTRRDDRDRLRFRARFGFNYQYDEHISFGVRMRSGAAAATQSPHVTLGSELTLKTFSLDKAFVRVASQSGSFWLGKNSFPFWKQNELFWDDDATPEGAAGSYTVGIGEGSRLTATGGYFILDTPASNTFADQARLMAGQLVLKAGVNAGSAEVAGGFFAFRENPEQDDPRLEDLDYSIGVAGAKVAVNVGARPVEIGADVMVNFEEYPASMFNHDQTTGYVASLTVGRLSKKKDWLLAYYYGHVQKYAVVGRYAQDDWVRWGSATATRSSNFQGHEFRAALALGSKNNLVARLYVVEGVKRESPSATAKEDGVRFRIDWNIGF